MTTLMSETQNSLQVRFHKLYVTDGEVTITKNKAILNKKFLLAFMLIILGVALFRSLPRRSPDSFPKPIELREIVFLSALGICTALTFYLSVKRLSRVVSNFKLKRQDSLFINGKTVALLPSGKTAAIVIQAVAGHKGIGTSHTVGVAVERKFWGLCYELDEIDAGKIADFLSSHLNLKIERREAAVFPLFKLH